MNDQRAVTIFDLYNRVLTLKLLPRTGWLQRGVTNVESIAEHTFGVATLALLVGDQIPGLDRGRLLTIALLHDMAEVLISDLPASARRFLGAGVKRDAERRALVELFAELPQADEYLQLWTEYTEGSSREGRLIKALDRIEMLSQALVYEQAGSRMMTEFWDEVEEAWGAEFPVVHSLLNHLVSARLGLNGVYHNGKVAHTNGKELH